MAIKTNPNGKHIQVKCVDCSAKPNPTKGPFELKIKGFIGSDLRFKLFNLDGKLLKSHCIVSSVTNFFIGNCEDGPYFLKIMNKEALSKTIRIIKY